MKGGRRVSGRDLVRDPGRQGGIVFGGMTDFGWIRGGRARRIVGVGIGGLRGRRRRSGGLWVAGGVFED
jgi:hypothetical protein